MQQKRQALVYLLISKEAMVISKEHNGIVVEFIAGQTIAYSITLQVNGEVLLSFEDPHSQGGDIYSCIGLSGDEETVVPVLRELGRTRNRKMLGAE